MTAVIAFDRNELERLVASKRRGCDRQRTTVRARVVISGHRAVGEVEPCPACSAPSLGGYWAPFHSADDEEAVRPSAADVRRCLPFATGLLSRG